MEAIIAAEHNPVARTEVTPVVLSVIEAVAQLVRDSQASGQTVADFDADSIAVTFVGAAMGLTAVAAFIEHDKPVETRNALTDVYLRLMHAFNVEPWTIRVPDAD